MVARVRTLAFHGVEGLAVDVQVMIAPGRVGMQIVGLPDKAVAESRERVQAALHASGLALPAKKVRAAISILRSHSVSWRRSARFRAMRWNPMS